MKKAYLKRDRLFYIVAGTTRLELATSGVTADLLHYAMNEINML